MNISLALEMAAEGMGERTAIGSGQIGVSYRALHFRARKLAGFLRSKGVSRVGYHGLNSEAFPLLLFASALAGATFTPISYRLSDGQLRPLLSRLAPALIFVEHDNCSRIGGAGIETVCLDSIWTAFDSFDPVAEQWAGADDVAVSLFTSGTTGQPKQVLLRHRHLISYVLTTSDFMGAPDHEATLISVPPYHVAGIMAILSATVLGRRIVYQRQFDAAEWVRIAQRQGATHAMVVPTMLKRIVDVLGDGETALPMMAQLAYGGGRMPTKVIEQAMDTLPHVGFINAYGLTETSSTIAILTPDDHRLAKSSDDPDIRRRLGSVGRPLPSVEIEVRDSSGMSLPCEEVGEIVVRGAQIAGEYSEGTALTEDGWFPTHDRGFLDRDGFLFVDGRLDDVIVRGGENLSPGEIEDVLLRHPTVADAAVTGVPDDEWGEAIAAVVVLEPGAEVTKEELQEHVRLSLRSSWVPALIDFRESLPYNEMGKLSRRFIWG